MPRCWLCAVSARAGTDTPATTTPGLALNPLHAPPTLRPCTVKNALQLQNLEMGSKIKGAKLTEEPQFIKFANEDTLAIVTGKSVFHWNRSGTSPAAAAPHTAPYSPLCSWFPCLALRGAPTGAAVAKEASNARTLRGSAGALPALAPLNLPNTRTRPTLAQTRRPLPRSATAMRLWRVPPSCTTPPRPTASGS